MLKYQILILCKIALKRCDDCNILRKSWNMLHLKLKGMPEFSDMVVGEADCCKESDLCATYDRKTKCAFEETESGNLLIFENFRFFIFVK